ncbi:MAG: hypothetical protein IJ864_01185 [Alphaproteobacteria bacterium]|nr:hypothetical protein [Alphaproteobacteria bacterium]
MAMENMRADSETFKKIAIMLKNGQEKEAQNLIEQNFGQRGVLLYNAMRSRGYTVEQMVQIFNKIAKFVNESVDKINAAAKKLQKQADEQELAAQQAALTQIQAKADANQSNWKV